MSWDQQLSLEIDWSDICEVFLPVLLGWNVSMGLSEELLYPCCILYNIPSNSSTSYWHCISSIVLVWWRWLWCLALSMIGLRGSSARAGWIMAHPLHTVCLVGASYCE
jgi:hypothetical protein